MKSFEEYLLDAVKIYEFRLKVAGEIEEEKLSKIESRLEKYNLLSFGNVAKTPIQESPLGFNSSVKNTEISIIDFETEYPVTPPELQNIIKEVLCLPDCCVVVVNKNHPCEQESQNEETNSEKALLDSDYPKSTGKVPYGDKFIASLLRKHKSDKIKVAGGNTAKATDTNSLPQGKQSPLG